MDLRIFPARGDKGLPSDNPYILSTNARVSLPDLLEIIKNHAYRRDDSQKPEVYVTFVYASGRVPECIGQIGLTCDALYTPEVALTLAERLPGCKVNVRSVLDMDLLYEINENDGQLNGNERPHIILCGTGDINVITSKVISFYGVGESTLRPGQPSAYSAELIGYERNRYTAPVYPNYACLVAARSPWSNDRLVIICGGIFGVGTVAAIWLLKYYLEGKGHNLGNNIHNPQVPGKIIEGMPRQYGELENQLKRIPDLIPQHDVRSLANKEFPIRVIE